MAEERSSLYLPEALEDEILLHLPVKSIFRFESVCKRWHSLFRSKDFPDFYFGSGHYQASLPSKKGLCLIYPELRLRARRRRCGTRILTSAIGPLSNGIYALTSVLKNYYSLHRFYLHTLKIALFNPTTRRIEFAAPFPDEYLPRLTGISSHDSYVSCGIDDDYRVVVLIEYQVISRNEHRSCFLVFLYTWRTGEWERLIDYNPGRSQIGLPPGPDIFEFITFVVEDMTACSQKLLNGCWHWLTHQYAEEDIENSCFRFMVLSFDFETKSFGLIRGPPCKTSTRADVFVLRDHLAVIVTPEPSENTLLQIWMKKKDPETIWTNIYSADPNLEPVYFYKSILYGVDYYQVQEEPESIRIKSLKLFIRFGHLIRGKLVTFDDKGVYQVAEEEEDPDQIPLSVTGISAFRPTFEPLPGSTEVSCSSDDSYDLVKLQSTVDYAKSLPVWKSDSVVKSSEQIREIPFVFKPAMLLVNKSEIVLASMASFEAGFAHNLFAGWATDQKICILFTERGQFGALARILQPDPATTKAVKAIISRIIHLVSVGGRRDGGTNRDDLTDGFIAVHMFCSYDSSAGHVIMEANMDQPFMQVQVKCFSVYMDSILAHVAPLRLITPPQSC